MNLINEATDRVQSALRASGVELSTESARIAVRTVLAAIHEPNDDMIDAGSEIVRNVSEQESDEAYRNDAANVWRYMVDAVNSGR